VREEIRKENGEKRGEGFGLEVNKIIQCRNLVQSLWRRML
jgi:hypothetical protein